MRVVALVSGGKDSCYNMVICERYGHQVVALANLLPQEVEADDLDSYMYQTVGHQVIAAYAQCMGLPLFRRRIRGSARQQQLVYEEAEGDEVEDLYALLAFVKQRMPDVQAVASGAIASDYQRTRVERVCARLGLVSLAYLWQQPQAPLLQRMIDSHIDAILVKIAAAGLTPRRHLGAGLASLPQQLANLRRMYGCNVCGEGGEYESLTLDCPLFRHGRIVLDSWQTVMVSEDRLAPVALLHPTAFHVEPKQAAQQQQQGQQPEQEQGERQQQEAAGEGPGAAVIEVPIDYEPAPSVTAALSPSLPPPASTANATAEAAVPGSSAGFPVWLSCTEGREYVTLAAEVPRLLPVFDGSPAGSAAATAGALAAALGALGGALPALGLSWRSALFVHLYVPSMAHFAAANEAYARFFPPINPPSRATVEIGPNPELALVVEVLLARRPEGRRVLHVQSISEWAPSCIGPYSQALSHNGLILMAGQIALDPPTMAMVGAGLDAQCLRALHSCQAVAVAMRTDLPRAMLWCTVYLSGAAGAAGAQHAAQHLGTFLRGELASSAAEACAAGSAAAAAGGAAASAEGVGSAAGGSNPEGSASESEDPEARAADLEDLELDEYLVPPSMQRHWEPLLCSVVMPELPRGGLVEIQPVACVVDASIDAESSSSSDTSEGDSDEEGPQPGSRGSPRRRQQQRGSMPGWIGRLEQWEQWEECACAAGGDLGASGSPGPAPQDGEGGAAATAGALAALSLGSSLQLHCRALCSPGRLCRAHAIVHAAGTAATPSDPAAQQRAQQPWQEALVQQLLGALRHAQLEASDVAALKVYCPTKASLRAGQALRGTLRAALGDGVAAALVPVVAVGWEGRVDAALAVELLAVRAPA